MNTPGGAVAQRKRRIIFNNDGCDVWVHGGGDDPVRALLDARTTELNDSQVDSIFYCTLHSGFSQFTHNTSIGQIFAPQGPKYATNLTQTLISQGTDALQVMIDHCRAVGKEIVWSMRMNDTHDGWGGDQEKLLLPELKKEHPEWLVGTRENPPAFGRWSAVDFAREEIRDLAFRFVEEVCLNYDVDGVELDFFRHPTYFKRPAYGDPAGDEERAMMTSLVERIRRMMCHVGEKRGRPFLLAMRVPDSVELCRDIGLDIEQWLHEGWCDLLSTTCYFRLQPRRYSVELGHRYGVPVYPCLSESRVKDPEGRSLRMSIEGYRGRAMNCLQAGADGIYIFNCFDPKHPLWREVGEAESMRGRNKRYFASVLGHGGLHWRHAKGETYRHIPKLSPDEPVVLSEDELKLDVYVGEEFPSLGTRFGVDVDLCIDVSGVGHPRELCVTLNDRVMTEWRRAGRSIEYNVWPDQIRRGRNVVGVATAGENGGGAAKLLDVFVSTRYAQ